MGSADTFGMCAMYVGWFYAIPLLALYGFMGFLLHWLCKPFVEIFDWKEKKKAKIIWLVICSVVCVVLTALVQSEVFGFEKGTKVPTWPI
jgi:hypothetical protein